MLRLRFVSRSRLETRLRVLRLSRVKSQDASESKHSERGAVRIRGVGCGVWGIRYGSREAKRRIDIVNTKREKGEGRRLEAGRGRKG